MEEGVAGRGAMKERGVLGGSILGITFFQAETKASSVEAAAGRSVEKDLVLAERKERANRLEARRNMAEREGGRSALARSERDEEGEGEVEGFRWLCLEAEKMEDLPKPLWISASYIRLLPPFCWAFQASFWAFRDFAFLGPLGFQILKWMDIAHWAH